MFRVFFHTAAAAWETIGYTAFWCQNLAKTFFHPTHRVSVHFGLLSLSSPFSPSHRQPEIEPRTLRIRRIFNCEFANSIANRKCRSANRKFRTRGWCFAPKIISDSWSFFTSRFLTILFDCVVPHAESFFPSCVLPQNTCA